MIIAIGDIHGRFDKLQELLALLPEEGELVFLGDYVDRGPQSAEVVALLRETAHICLLGNHEELMIDAILHGQTYMWHINGGLETIQSYKNLYGEDKAWMMMESDAEWMQTLPCSYTTDTHIFVHAGLNPRREVQTREDMIWIRDLFLRSDKDFGRHVVHGHTHSHETKKYHDVELLANRTNLDTAAFHTGILSAAIIDGDTTIVVQTEADE
jgi:serine/threonine protein phosphatase 1